jgi:hypothetical protein
LTAILSFDYVPGFLIAQLLGAASATALFAWLVPAQGSNDGKRWTLRDTRPGDREGAELLLRAAGLPTDGVGDPALVDAVPPTSTC